MLVTFGFFGDVICDGCDTVGRHMKIFLNFYAWLHGHGVNIGCSKTTEIFWGGFWIFCLGYCWVLM